MLEADDVSPHIRDSILQKRASQIAESANEQSTTKEIINVLTFQLGEEQYAVEAKSVQAVAKLNHITPVPCVPFILSWVLQI